MRGARLGFALGAPLLLLLYGGHVTIRGAGLCPPAPTQAWPVQGSTQRGTGAPQAAGTGPGAGAPTQVLFDSSRGKGSIDRVNRNRCLKEGPFKFQPLVRKQEFDWAIHSLVQSVRLDGPSGLPMRCDWVLGTRMSHWRKIPANTAFGDPVFKPKTIFVQTDNRQAFHDHILPCLGTSERFVLIIGDHDKTTPRQIDVRYKHEPYFKYATWLAWLQDPRIVHIFVEHLDEKSALKVSPIPVGLNPQEMSRGFMHLKTEHIAKRFPVAALTSRPLKARFTNRIRDGTGQWASRYNTRVACDTKWKQTCVSSPAPKGDEYYKEIAKYPFLICAHGGGIDPNPNVWSALLVGTIPIIERFAGDSMYRDLPVVVLEDLPNANLSLSQLQVWRDSLGKMFEGHHRRRVLQKLSNDYWWNQVMSKVHRNGTIAHVR